MCMLYLLVVRVCVASHHSVLQSTTESVLQCVAVCCIVFQCVVACCNAWQNVSCLIVVSFRAQHTMCCNVLQRVAACCSVLQRVAACLIFDRGVILDRGMV